MKKFLFIVCSLMGISSVNAQTYEISGRIIDESTNEPLPGVTVYDAVSFNGTSTDMEGQFRLGNLKKGETTLTLSYLGYQTLHKVVNMPADSNKEMTFRLKPSNIDLGEVVVTGSFEGQQRAINQQRTAHSIKNVVSADLIGKFPVTTTTESPKMRITYYKPSFPKNLWLHWAIRSA